MKNTKFTRARLWLVNARMCVNMKQEEVASLAGVSRPYYCQLENGVRTPSPQKAKKIAGVLNTDWTYFYEEPDKIPHNSFPGSL
jgi:transcriptional regulator with XRE-family HTH domain